MKLRYALAFWSIVSAIAPMGISGAGTLVVDATAAYPEGPLWRNGKLLYVEYAGPGIKIWDGRHVRSYWSGDHCGASGLIAYRRNHILVACYDANQIVELDDERKAAMVSNLMVVLCCDQPASPIVNAGTLY